MDEAAGPGRRRARLGERVLRAVEGCTCWSPWKYRGWIGGVSALPAGKRIGARLAAPRRATARSGAQRRAPFRHTTREDANVCGDEGSKAVIVPPSSLGGQSIVARAVLKATPHRGSRLARRQARLVEAPFFTGAYRGGLSSSLHFTSLDHLQLSLAPPFTNPLRPTMGFGEPRRLHSRVRALTVLRLQSTTRRHSRPSARPASPRSLPRATTRSSRTSSRPAPRRPRSPSRLASTDRRPASRSSTRTTTRR